MSEKHSEVLRELWKDPEYQAHHAEGNKRSTKLRGQKLKEKWADPEFRAKQIATRATPEFKKRMEQSKAARSEAMKKRWQDPEFRAHLSAARSAFAKTRHGETAPVYKHGMYRSPEYVAYHAAKQRCNNPRNPKFVDYGGRGIQFLYTSFEQFIAELGPRPSPLHSLDRIRVNGPYGPGNCQWALPWEQVKNRRKYNALESYPDAALIAEYERRGLGDVPEYGLSGC